MRGCSVLGWTSRNLACFIAVIRVAAADPVTQPAAIAAPSTEAPAPSGGTQAAQVAPVGAPSTHGVPHATPGDPAPIAPRFRPMSDLDGTYLWLGPLGAASHIDDRWDSTFGADAALVVVRESARLALVGANLGASRWTARGGGRVWVDGLVGTHLVGRIAGISLGPIFELSELAHPRPGASIGVWCFTGITPFARLGAVANLGMFAEIGIHIALPVLRR